MKEPVRVLFLSAEYPPVLGGVSLFARNLAAAIAALGHPIRVMTTAVAGAATEAVAAIEVVRISGRGGKAGKVASFVAGALRDLFTHRGTVLVCGRLSYEGAAAFLSRRLFGTRYVLVVHGSEVLRHRGRRMRERLVGVLLRSAAHIVANSSYTRDLVIASGVAPGAVTVIHPLIDLRDYDIAPASIERAREKFALSSKRVLLTVGQLTARKGHGLVFRAIQKLLPSRPDLHYVVVGGAGESAAALRQLASDLGIAGHLTFTGYLPQAEVNALYALADVYVMPTHEHQGDVEGFGISFVEAGIFGKAVIGGRGGGTADAIVDGETGFLIDADDEIALQDRLVRLLDDRDLAKRFGEAGRERVTNLLSIDAQLPKVREVLAHVA